MWNKLVDAVNPIIIIAAIVVVVLFLFLAAVYMRLGWEHDFFGLKRWWKRRQRRRRRVPPVYGPLEQELPPDHPKVSS